MNGILIGKLLMLRGLLQEGDTDQAEALLSELIVRMETGDSSGGHADKWLSLFLDEEHRRLLSGLDEASGSDVEALERHVESRRALLELALNAGDLAKEIAHTYELLGDAGYEDAVAEDAERELA